MANHKSPLVLALTISSWVFISFLSFQYFAVRLPDSYGLIIPVALKLLFLSWMLFWLWGIHNFWHQTLSLFAKIKKPKLYDLLQDQPVVILYTTCDDFDGKACISYLSQTHKKTRIVICDDSSENFYRQQIDEWANHFKEKVMVVRRPNRKGFKAGNLNHAIRNFVKEEFVLICDADEIIPPDFIEKLLQYFDADDIAFVQARHKPCKNHQTKFAAILLPNIDIFYKYTLSLRNRFGFVSCFGHGVIIRRSVWHSINGFPEIISEDLGFASRALANGLKGVYAEDVVAEETFPLTYTAFVKRYSRICQGTIEYFQKEFLFLLKSSKATFTEKLDLLLTFSFCYIGLVTMINLLGGLFLSYIYKLHGYIHLEFWIFCIYLIGPLTPIVPLIRNISRQPIRYFNYSITSALVYVSLMPILAIKAVITTFKITNPTFESTGKIGRQKQSFYQHAFIGIFGLITLSITLWLHSSVFIPSLGFSLMCVLGPAMCFTDSVGINGLIARNVVFLPHIVMLWLLFYRGL